MMDEDVSGETYGHKYGRNEYPSLRKMRTVMVAVSILLLLISAGVAFASERSGPSQLQARGLFCDYQNQLTHIIRYWDGKETIDSNLSELVQFVNSTYGTRACGVTKFTIVSRIFITENICNAGLYQVWRVQVTAVSSITSKVWTRLPGPVEQFYLYLPPGQETRRKTRDHLAAG